MTRRLVVTNSERATFLQCRKRWWFEYRELLRPVVRARALTWGVVIHGAIHAGYLAFFDGGRRGQLPIAKEAAANAIDQQAKQVRTELELALVAERIGEDECEARLADTGKLAETGAWLVQHFFERTQADLSLLVPIAFEVPTLAPVLDAKGRANHLWNEGQVDAVWWDPQSTQVVIDDQKTTEGDVLSNAVDRRISLDPQMSGYINGVRHMCGTGQLRPMFGPEIDPHVLANSVRGWCRYNVLRRAMPHQPAINKDGHVSVAAIDTTAEIYARALAEQEVKRELPMTEKQRDLLFKLDRQGDRYFSRYEFVRSPQDENDWRSDLMVDARQMRAAERDPRLCTRNPGVCTPANALPCPYRQPCLRDEPETRAAFRIATDRHEEVKRNGQEKREEEAGEQGQEQRGSVPREEDRWGF